MILDCTRTKILNRMKMAWIGSVDVPFQMNAANFDPILSAFYSIFWWVGGQWKVLIFCWIVLDVYPIACYFASTSFVLALNCIFNINLSIICTILSINILWQNINGIMASIDFLSREFQIIICFWDTSYQNSFRCCTGCKHDEYFFNWIFQFITRCKVKWKFGKCPKYKSVAHAR